MQSSHSYSSRPLLSPRSFSGPLSPSKAPPRSPPASSSKFKVAANRLKRPHKGLLVLLACVLGVVVISSAFSQDGEAEWDSWRMRTRAKASEGLIKAGGRIAGQNESYTANLLPDRNYITAFHMAGLNNQVLIQFNLLHLAFLLRTNGPSPTPYVPVLPPFYPHFHHLKGGQGASRAPVLRFSQMFDLDRFAEEVGWGVVEWSELKEGFTGREEEGGGGFVEDEWATEEERRKAFEETDKKSVRPMGEGVEMEKLGVWSSWQVTNTGGDLGRNNVALYYNLKPSYTPLPPSLFSPMNHSPAHLLLPSVANFLSPPDNRLREDYLSFASGEAERLVTSWPGNRTLETVFGKEGWVEPSNNPGQITCIDNLYFASDKGEEVREVFEATAETGAWYSVGRHARWNTDLRKLSVDILRGVLLLPPGKVVPNVFTVHIRRTDFLDGCPDYAKPCFATSDFAKHISKMRQDFIDEGRSDARDWPVIVTTDEKNPAYLAEMTALGWTLIDHSLLETKNTHGIWYPSLVDNVVLSLGQGFFGTTGSTMSILAARRVQDWNGGKAELVGLLEGFFQRSP